MWKCPLLQKCSDVTDGVRFFLILFMTTSQSDSNNILPKYVPNIRKTLMGKFEVCFEVSIHVWFSFKFY